VAGLLWLTVVASYPRNVLSLNNEIEEEATLWIVNVSAQAQSVDMTELVNPARAQLNVLDADTMGKATKSGVRSVAMVSAQLELSPFAVARVHTS
jgi:hypothetical protein